MVVTKSLGVLANVHVHAYSNNLGIDVRGLNISNMDTIWIRDGFSRLPQYIYYSLIEPGVCFERS